MSAQHTQGRLVAVHFRDGAYDLRTEQEAKKLTTQCVASFVQHPDARRLAACWNICEYIPTDYLETGATLAGICAKSNGYQVKLAAASALLAEVLEEDGASLDTESRIRAFLKGGA